MSGVLDNVFGGGADVMESIYGGDITPQQYVVGTLVALAIFSWILYGMSFADSFIPWFRIILLCVSVVTTVVGGICIALLVGVSRIEPP